MAIVSELFSIQDETLTQESLISSIGDTQTEQRFSRADNQSTDGRAFRLSEGSDRFVVTPNLTGQYIQGILGLEGNDTLEGIESSDFLNGNTGDDWLLGRAGDDLLYGGAGSDTLDGEDGDDVIGGNLGNDLLRGGAGIDALNGNEGEDTLLGGEGDDLLRGGRGNDILNGGAGDDLLIGDLGTDFLTGGAGSDTFSLRSDGPPQSLNQADILTDFSKAEDLIALDLDLKESDLSLESTVVNNQPSTVIRVPTTNSVLGIAQGVTPDDLRGRFINLDAEPVAAQNIVTYSAPTVRNPSPNLYELVLNGSDGSEYVTNIVRSPNEVTAREVTYKPGPQSTMPAHKLAVSADGKRTEIQITGSKEKTIFQQNADGSVVLKRQREDGKEEEIVSLVEPSPSLALSLTTTTPVVSAKSNLGCDLLKGACDFLDKNNISDKLALLGGLAAATGIGVGAGGILELAAAGTKVLEFGCLVMTGTDGDVFEKSFDLLPFGKLKFVRNLQAGVLKVTKQGIRTAVESSVGRKVLEKLGKIGVDEIFGDAASQVSKKGYEITSGLYKKLADQVGFKPGDGMKTLRKSLGLDFCDEIATPTPPTPPTQQSLKAEITPKSIPFGSSGNLKVSFTDPTSSATTIEFGGLTQGAGSPFTIPANSRSGGDFNFSVQNTGFRGRECYSLPYSPSTGSKDNASLDVFISRTSGSSLKQNLLFELAGKGGVGQPCSFTVTPA